MTQDRWKACTKKELLAQARDRGLKDLTALTKEQLIRALVNADKPRATKPPARRQAAAARSTLTATPKPAAARPSCTEVPVEAPRHLLPTLAHDCVAPVAKDRIALHVLHAYWLHCTWELSAATIARAEAALGHDWHTAKPILRLVDVTCGDVSGSAEKNVRDIEVHGGCNHWYIDVAHPPRSFRVDLGYLSRQGRFYVLCRSNPVATPPAGHSDALTENWTTVQQLDRSHTLANGEPGPDLNHLFDERLRRPMADSLFAANGCGTMGRRRKFWFKLDAELIVYGAADPTAKVTLQGDPLPLRPDGTFTVRFGLPEGRQIIPAVAASADGVEERTIVLAVERNTKALEPMIHDTSAE